jgi:dTDP-4-amino-4,6-dideoxygalactose transaminase
MSVQASETLAIDGGTPLRTRPMPVRGLFGAEEKAAVVALFDECIRSGDAFSYGGPQEESYCAEFAQLLGGGFADAVNSGTSAVYVALKALDVQPFTEVIVPALSDAGGLMPVPLLNCIPIVADARPGSYNVGPDEIEAVLSPRTSALLVAHLGGEAVEMDPVLELARARGVPVIEDCAQAHGARYKGRPVGTLGTIAAFSTMSGKHHATGAQGGVVFTRDEALYWRARQASDRGKPFGGLPEERRGASLNLNSNDLAATIGRVQLRKLPGIVSARRRVAGEIAAGLRRSTVVSPGWQPAGSEASYWFLRLHVDGSKIGVDPTTFARAVSREGIPLAPAYSGALQGTAPWLTRRRVFGESGYPWAAPEYRASGGDPERRFACPNALAVLESDFNLSIHEAWGEDEVWDTLAAIEKVERAYRSS